MRDVERSSDPDKCQQLFYGLGDKRHPQFQYVFHHDCLELKCEEHHVWPAVLSHHHFCEDNIMGEADEKENEIHCARNCRRGMRGSSYVRQYFKIVTTAIWIPLPPKVGRACGVQKCGFPKHSD